MGHYDDCYEREQQAYEERQAKRLEKLKKEFPEEHKLALKYQKLKSAYNIFKHLM